MSGNKCGSLLKTNQILEKPDPKYQVAPQEPLSQQRIGTGQKP
jgi:hypothetical protein